MTFFAWSPSLRSPYLVHFEVALAFQMAGMSGLESVRFGCCSTPSMSSPFWPMARGTVLLCPTLFSWPVGLGFLAPRLCWSAELIVWPV